MREETLKRKEKRSKLKEQLSDVEKDIHVKGQKLSTAEKNYAILTELSKRKVSKKEEDSIEESETPGAIEKTKIRSDFICACGVHVFIESDQEAAHLRKSCTKCLPLR